MVLQISVLFESNDFDLRTIVCAMFETGWTLFWACIMMAFLIFLCTMFVIQVITPYVEEAADIQDPVVQDLNDYYGTIDKGMTSLFSAISGGEDWRTLARPLGEISPIYTIVFSMYVFWMVFGLESVLIAVFTQKAMEACRIDRSIAAQNQSEQTKSFLVALKKMYHEMDPTLTGQISWAHFRDHVKQEEVLTYLMSQGLNILDARHLFQLMDELDDDPSDTMGFADFVSGMIRLSGTARSSDVMLLRKDSHKQTRMLQSLSERLDELSSDRRA